MDIEKLMNDEAFVEQIKNAKDLAEVAALLQAQGVEVTEEELKSQLSAEEGELDESALEEVAGGGIYRIISQLAKKLIKKSSGKSSSGGGKGASGSGGGGGRIW